MIEECNPKRVELPKHVFERAKRRNADPTELEMKILNGEFEEVRENNQHDPNFEYNYKVKIESNGCLVELPIYFNVPGPKVLVKSFWLG